MCLQDTELAWELESDGIWRKIQPEGDRANAQQALAAHRQGTPPANPQAIGNACSLLASRTLEASDQY
jgi:hypothetical protein